VTQFFKFFDKTSLIDAAETAQERGYNRQLDPKLLGSELSDEHCFPVSFSMLHEHAAGELVAPHVRAMIVVNENGDSVLLDVDMGVFNALPEVEVQVPVKTG